MSCTGTAGTIAYRGAWQSVALAGPAAAALKHLSTCKLTALALTTGTGLSSYRRQKVYNFNRADGAELECPIMDLSDDAMCDRLDRYGALYILCTRHHSGQWSRGYRLLSRLTLRGYSPGLSVSNGRFESDAQRDYYRRWYTLRRTL